MAIVFTDAGQEGAVDLFDPATRGAESSSYYGHWGSGATAPAVSQTALVTAHSEARVACTVSQPSTNTVRYAFTITADGSKDIVEFAVFDANAAGNMWIRGTHGTQAVIVGDQIAYQVNLLTKDSSE